LVPCRDSESGVGAEAFNSSFLLESALPSLPIGDAGNDFGDDGALSPVRKDGKDVCFVTIRGGRPKPTPAPELPAGLLGLPGLAGLFIAPHLGAGEEPTAFFSGHKLCQKPSQESAPEFR
jgi:hypothetical protein